MNNPFDKESWTEQEKEIINAGGWQCSFCGSINASYVTSCACGHNQDDSYENLHGRYVPRPDEEYTEQQSQGETLASVEDSAETETSFEEIPAAVETPFEEIPAAAESPFEEIPVAEDNTDTIAETPAAFEEIPAAPATTEAESPFEEIPAAPATAEAESPFEEIPVAEDTADTTAEASAPIEEFTPAEESIAADESTSAENSAGENTVTAIPEPISEPAEAAPAAPPVKKPVSKTNKPMEEYSPYEQGILNDGGWECAFCGTINASYVTSCSCGHSEDDSFLKRRGKYTGPDAEETETSTAEAAPAAPTPAAATPAASAAPASPADMIAEIEQELAADNSEMAKFRAIRKYKNLVKKGYMTKEEFNKKQDELLSFEDDDAMAAPESSGEDNA